MISGVLEYHQERYIAAHQHAIETRDVALSQWAIAKLVELGSVPPPPPLPELPELAGLYPPPPAPVDQVQVKLEPQPSVESKTPVIPDTSRYCTHELKKSCTKNCAMLNCVICHTDIYFESDGLKKLIRVGHDPNCGICEHKIIDTV